MCSWTSIQVEFAHFENQFLGIRLQWRKGLGLGKDNFDHDLVAVGDNEVLRCKAVRKASEAILGLKVSPENLRRGSKTVLKQGRPPLVDVQLLGEDHHMIRMKM